MKPGDFVQLKSNPGVLLGQYEEDLWLDDDQRMVIAELPEPLDCYINSDGVRTISIQMPEGVQNHLTVKPDEVERWVNPLCEE